MSQTSEALTEAAEQVAEVSHFTRLMSESMGGGGRATRSQSGVLSEEE